MEQVRIAFPWGDVVVEREPMGPREPVDAAAQQLARRVVFELRYGIETRDPFALGAARAIAKLLSNTWAWRFDANVDARAEGPFANSLPWHIEQALYRGQLRLSVRRQEQVPERHVDALPELPKLSPPRETTDTSFEVRFVDEIGQALSGVEVELAVNGEPQSLRTNLAGVALLENVQPPSASATVAVPDPVPLEKLLDARWNERRPGRRRSEGNTTTLVFAGAPIAPIPLKAAVPNMVVLTPTFGELFVELFDKTGRARHLDCEYVIRGPEQFSGRTDGTGRLRHEQVLPGDYTLSLTVEFERLDHKEVDTYESPLVVLQPGAAAEIRKLGAVPLSVLSSLRFVFNTSKAFLLPTALPGFRMLRAIYAQNDPSELLVVGHADTAGSTTMNDELSLERARATLAFLEDDVDAWLAFYEPSVQKSRRWGAVEDRLMLLALPDFRSKPRGEPAVRWFQRTRGLTIDNVAGPQTRRQLITEYMSLDGVSLAESGIAIQATAHGCGEHFPLDEAGQALDPSPTDGRRDPADRRVELFFFDPEFGIFPTPPGENSAAGSPHYPAWRASAVEEHEFAAGPLGGRRALFIELIDALFRTSSAVVLPEGEAPTDRSEHRSLTSIGAFAILLRFNEEQPGRSVLLAGHADTTAGRELNQKLSEERAACALAILTGDRETFKAVCSARHVVADYGQILSWLARAFPAMFGDCDPGASSNESAVRDAVRRFQRAYNINRAALGATAPELVVDGDVGPLTWGALFDCYEFALQQELGEDASGVRALRDKLVFVDDRHKALGFGELFPIEELGVDNYQSQANRRVELLLFEPGEEPDVEHAAEDPETAELYLPGYYARRPLRGASARPGAFTQTLKLRILDATHTPIANAPYELRVGEFVRRGHTDDLGTLTEPLVPVPNRCLLRWQLPRGDAHEVPDDEASEAESFPFERALFLDYRQDEVLDRDESARKRLHNLGYETRDLNAAIAQFQLDRALEQKPWFDSTTFDELCRVHDEVGA